MAYGTRTTVTGQPGLVNLDGQPTRTAWTGEPRQNTVERTCQDMTATLGQQHQESREHDCWGGIAGTGHLGQDSRDPIARRGQARQERDRTARDDSRDSPYIQDRKQKTR
jgi:hypothetical protein